MTKPETTAAQEMTMKCPRCGVTDVPRRWGAGVTHWTGCHESHLECALAKLRELENELVAARGQIAMLKEQLTAQRGQVRYPVDSQFPARQETSSK